MRGCSPNFQDIFTPRGSRAGLGGIMQQLLLLRFWGLNFVGVSPYFQDMFTPKGSRVD